MKTTTDKDKLKTILESIQDELEYAEYQYNTADEQSAESTDGTVHMKRYFTLNNYHALRRVAAVAGLELAPIIVKPRKQFVPPSERIASAAE